MENYKLTSFRFPMSQTLLMCGSQIHKSLTPASGSLQLFRLHTLACTLLDAHCHRQKFTRSTIVILGPSFGINPIANRIENFFDVGNKFFIHGFFDPIAPLRNSTGVQILLHNWQTMDWQRSTGAPTWQCHFHDPSNT